VVATNEDFSPATLFTSEERDGLRVWFWSGGVALPLLSPPFDRSERKPKRGLVSLPPLTVAKDRLLELVGSPVATGAAFNRFTLLQTLWILSPAYRYGAWWSFAFWALRHCLLPFDRTCAALRRWHAAQFIDRPPREVHRNKARGSSTYSFATFALVCKHRLSLSEETFLASPVGRCLQQIAALESGRGGDRPDFDPEKDRAVGDYLRAKAARQQEARN
jgi:hypothetical protein